MIYSTTFTWGRAVRALVHKAFTVLAVFSTVTGWVLLSNLPRYSEGGSIYRTTSVDYATRQPWIGIGLLGAGISYFVLRLMNNPVNRN